MQPQKSSQAVLNSNPCGSLVGQTPRLRIYVDDPLIDPDAGSGQPDKTMVAAVGPLAAASIARFELQTLLETRLPSVRIVGPRRLTEKRLAVVNPTADAVTVTVQLRSRTITKEGYLWTWGSGPVNGTISLRFTVPAKTKEPLLLEIDEGNRADDMGASARPVHGSRARIWVESASGERWTDDGGQELWLVETNDALGGDRAYEADAMATFVYTVKPPYELPTRVVLFQTPDSLVERQGVLPSTFLPNGSISLITESLMLETKVSGQFARTGDWKLVATDTKQLAEPQATQGTTLGLTSKGSKTMSLSYKVLTPDSRETRFIYHDTGRPWTLAYYLDIAAAAREVEGRRVVHNDSHTNWRRDGCRPQGWRLQRGIPTAYKRKRLNWAYFQSIGISRYLYLCLQLH